MWLLSLLVTPPTQADGPQIEEPTSTPLVPDAEGDEFGAGRLSRTERGNRRAGIGAAIPASWISGW
jgi:hypothetical protein